MTIKKHGISICCEECLYAGSDEQGHFELVVPVSDSETGAAGAARLNCTVSPQSHRVELGEWQDVNDRAEDLSESSQQRLSALLGFVAERRVCGNADICPLEIVKIVERAVAAPAKPSSPR